MRISAVNANTTVVTNTITITTTNGGSVVMTVSGADTGPFSYLPAAGFTGADTFTYTLKDSGPDGIAGNADDLVSTSPATVSITVANKVWYVDNSVGATGDARSSSPFKTIAEVSGATGPDAAGDIIYVRTGTSNYTGGITLLGTQTLWGENEALVVGGFTLKASGTDPVIANAAGGDVSGDHLADIIIGRNTGKPSQVEVFADDNAANLIPAVLGAPIIPFDADPLKPKLTGGVRVAVADVNFDGAADIIAAAGTKGGSKVKFFDGITHAAITPTRDFTAYPNFLDAALWVAGSSPVPG